jgi:hypothetical protein
MRCLTRCTPLAAALVAVCAQPAVAQKRDDAADDSSKRCISLPNLERTEIVDNRTIVFHMRNGRVYLNHLSRECPGLEREKRFMYSPTSSQLCEIDGVTVIEKWGFGFTRGFTCALGEFHPLTKAEFDALMHPDETRTLIEPEKVPADSAAPGGRGAAPAGGDAPPQAAETKPSDPASAPAIAAPATPAHGARR